MLITSGDSLARLACHKLFNCRTINIVAVVRVKINIKKKIKILRASVKLGSLWYAAYMQIELMFSAIYVLFKKNLPKIRGIKARSIYEESISALKFDNLNPLIKKYEPTLILSVRPGLIFKQSAISSAPPIINLHCSTLPAYAGIGGVIHALANEESMLGVSIHKIESEAIDSGELVAQELLKVDSKKSVLWHTLKLYDKASDTLLRYFENKTNIFEHKQLDALSYNSWPKYNVYRKLRSKGRGLVFPFW